MNIETISMDKEAARLAFHAYRDAVKKNRKDRRLSEDVATMNAFGAAAKGQAILDLHVVLKTAGVQASGYPVLAIMRADQEWCHVEMDRDGAARFQCVEYLRMGRQDRTKVINAPVGTFPTRDRWAQRRRAMVPTVPPHLMPKHALSNYHILWEAVWEPAPPVDPLLLKHLGGALYAVLAAWDLTPIERAVLRGRLTA